MSKETITLINTDTPTIPSLKHFDTLFINTKTVIIKDMSLFRN